MSNIPTFQEIAAKGFEFAHAKDWLIKDRIAMDAALITTPNTTVPGFLLQYVTPEVVPILTAKEAARAIFKEKKVGDWTTANVQYPIEEMVGSTAPYSDYGDGASSDVNTEWQNREQYVFQTTITYGDREVDMAAQAKLDLVAQKQRAAAAAINIDSNRFYLLGVSGKRIYGLLNDPNLPAAVTPNTVQTAVTWADKLALADGAGTLAVYNDILKLFGQLQTQTNGLINENTRMKLLVSPTRSVALNQSTNFNISVKTMLASNFPSMEIETVPQLSTASGETIMLVVTELAGIDTGELYFGLKMRQGRLIPETSSFKQKFSASTYGFAMKYPAAFAVMTGV